MIHNEIASSGCVMAKFTSLSHVGRGPTRFPRAFLVLADRSPELHVSGYSVNELNMH